MVYELEYSQLIQKINDEFNKLTYEQVAEEAQRILGCRVDFINKNGTLYTKDFKVQTIEKLTKCSLTSIWEDGSIVTTSCIYNIYTGGINPDVSMGLVPTGSLKEEFITLEGGKRKDVCPECHEYVLRDEGGCRYRICRKK